VEAFPAKKPTGEFAFFNVGHQRAPYRRAVEREPHRAHRLIGVDRDGSVVGPRREPGVGWPSHVGEIRLAVGPERCHTGIGLARAARRATGRAG
jgi:hypothetical protein